MVKQAVPTTTSSSSSSLSSSPPSSSLSSPSSSSSSLPAAPPESNDITRFANRGSNAQSLMEPKNKMEYVLATLDKIVNWAHQANDVRIGVLRCRNDAHGGSEV
ncbi:hypothetical protein FRC15_009162 [Serendipita sp. 397]|nr:hypothetical protein FRC15_009162 [Serendipita sp. 397]